MVSILTMTVKTYTYERLWHPICSAFGSGIVGAKGQLNSELIYEVIKSPKMQTKNYKNFCPTIQTRIVALFFGFLMSVGSFFGYDPCLFGWAEILVIFGLHFGRNDDLIKTF